MSNQHLVIDTDDKSTFDSLVDGSAIATTVHAHRSTARTVTESDDIDVTDEDNIIHVSASRTAIVVLTPTAGVEASDGLSFRVRVEYNGTYTVRIPIGGAFWEFNGFDDSVSGLDLAYSFNINASGDVVPENSAAITLYSPV
jgi:hypothetical protein